MTPWIILILSACLFLFSVKTGMSTYSWVAKAEAMEGTVVELVRTGGKKTTFAPRIVYINAGEDQQFTSTQSSNPPNFEIGEKVKVVVNAEKKEERIATFGQLYGYPLVSGLLALVMGISVIVFMNGNSILRLIHPNLG